MGLPVDQSLGQETKKAQDFFCVISRKHARAPNIKRRKVELCCLMQPFPNRCLTVPENDARQTRSFCLVHVYLFVIALFVNVCESVCVCVFHLPDFASVMAPHSSKMKASSKPNSAMSESSMASANSIVFVLDWPISNMREAAKKEVVP